MDDHPHDDVRRQTYMFRMNYILKIIRYDTIAAIFNNLYIYFQMKMFKYLQ